MPTNLKISYSKLLNKILENNKIDTVIIGYFTINDIIENINKILQ